ncbi:hypothetical protein IHE44_0005763 [Lamprotornis superbus]|uniref:Uncharacterized protein n=1 Tax=Lamprotornis superbus TaxID=245042 RepID=A0A835TQE2_9PASS|nr:hypothetical protein IHE44_0005763 [Lamprotornis superbus]
MNEKASLTHAQNIVKKKHKKHPGVQVCSQGGICSPTGKGVLVSWMGPQRFQHSVSPGLQLPELAPLTAYCVHGEGFSTSVNLFLSCTTTPGHHYCACTDIAFSQLSLALGQLDDVVNLPSDQSPSDQINTPAMPYTGQAQLRLVVKLDTRILCPADMKTKPSAESEGLKVQASEDVTVLGKPDERSMEIDDLMGAKMSCNSSSPQLGSPHAQLHQFNYQHGKTSTIINPLLDSNSNTRVPKNIHIFFLRQKNHIHHVSAQVNAEDGDCSQRKRYVCNDEDQERDDANTLGNGFGCDRMVSSNHDNLKCKQTAMKALPALQSSTAQKAGINYLDPCTSAFANSIWHSSTRWINHRHQSYKAELLYREVQVVCIKLEAIRELIIRQSQWLLFAMNKNGAAAIQDPLWSSLHHEQILDEQLIVLGPEGGTADVQENTSAFKISNRWWMWNPGSPRPRGSSPSSSYEPYAWLLVSDIPGDKKEDVSPEAKLAIRPITVRSPVLMTMPRAVPRREMGFRKQNQPQLNIIIKLPNSLSLLYLATMRRYDPKISNYNTFSVYAHLLTISDYKCLLKDTLYAISQKTQNSTNPQQERESSKELPTELYPFRSVLHPTLTEKIRSKLKTSPPYSPIMGYSPIKSYKVETILI